MKTPQKPLIIPVFLSSEKCRQHCIFCSRGATAAGGPDRASLPAFIEESLRSRSSRGPERERQIAFYGGSFTALDREDQISYLRQVDPYLKAGRLDSVRISTRPDALGEETLALLQTYRVRTVEIGIQSMIDEVLLLSNRGHSAADAASAVSRLKRQGFEVGVQLMIGLPGDSPERFLRTLDLLIDLRPDFVRIHPTLVLRGSPLESLWRSGRYSPLSLDEAVRWLRAGFLKLDRANIAVARAGLQPTKELEDHCLAGPYHPSINQLVQSSIAFDMAACLLAVGGRTSRVSFLCHPKEISTVRGHRNENIRTLRDRFALEEVSVEGRQTIARECLVLRTPQGLYSMRRGELHYEEQSPSRQL